MKVILLENVPSLGRADEVKEVSEGYARNFLFPRNLALQASPKALADIAAQQKKKTANAEAELRRQENLVEEIDGLEIEVTEKTNDQGVLYAAISPQKIIDALTKRGYAITKNELKMPAIKSLGDHKAKIKFKHGLEAEITIRLLADLA